MHDAVFYAAAAWTTVLLVGAVVAVTRARTTTRRILSLDMLTLLLVSLLVLYGTAERTPYYLDIALVLSLLAFLATVAAARYYGERRIF